MSSFTLTSLYNVSGLVVLITGGGSGIGLMIAKGFAANGAKVYIAGRRMDTLERAASSARYGDAGGSIVPLQMDVTDKESIRAAKATIEKADGKLNVLVNNAGQSGPRSLFIHARNDHLDASSFGDALFASESFDEWSAHFSVNVSSVYFVSTAFLGLLEKGSGDRGVESSIINITSISGVVKLSQDHFCYNSAKAAAGHLTKIMATEFALRKLPIRVNAIAPGVYASEMTTNAPILNREDTNGVGKPIVSIPAERGGTDEEIAATALFLASPGAGYITGQELVMDGGYLAVNPSTR